MKDMTIGEIIAAEERALYQNGGYRADYDVTTRTLTLIGVLPEGLGEQPVTSACVLPAGEIDYSEEVAHALLRETMSVQEADTYPLTISWVAS